MDWRQCGRMVPSQDFHSDAALYECGRSAVCGGRHRRVLQESRPRASGPLVPGETSHTHTHTDIHTQHTHTRQAGAFYPFMRAHAHLDTRRREPWLYDADKMAAIRTAVRLRYQLLPYWYSVFHETHRTGIPVLRPLWVEFPRDKNTWATEDQFMVGDSLLVHPVTEQGASSVQLYLPGTSTVS